jgi:putative endonuclease
VAAHHPSPLWGFGWQATCVKWGEGCLPKLREERRETRAAMWYVYFLGLSNGDIYVGSTNDLRRRVRAHSNGQVVSTRRHLPVALKSYVAVSGEASARALERYFKSGSGKAFAKKRFLASPVT